MSFVSKHANVVHYLSSDSSPNRLQDHFAEETETRRRVTTERARKTGNPSDPRGTEKHLSHRVSFSSSSVYVELKPAQDWLPTMSTLCSDWLRRAAMWWARRSKPDVFKRATCSSVWLSASSTFRGLKVSRRSPRPRQVTFNLSLVFVQ